MGDTKVGHCKVRQDSRGREWVRWHDGRAMSAGRLLPVSISLLTKNKPKHRIEDLASARYEKPHAWVLNKAVRYSAPYSYRHPMGAIVWVTL